MKVSDLIDLSCVKTASEEIDLLYKIASDNLKDIQCEQCQYQGPPDTDGRCPECGAMCGVKPTIPIPDRHNHDNQTGDMNLDIVSTQSDSDVASYL